MIRLASAVWSSLSALSRAGIRKGWIQPVRLDAARVISVGNIQVGGAGKTPLVARIAREGHERGLSVAILCRGYGAEWERSGGTIEPGQTDVSARLCGDEPVLLHELAPNAWIGVGADRVSRYRELVARAGRRFDLVILDDGFQNRKIRKDLEVVALTSLTRKDVLFRDWFSALRYADLLVWTKGETAPGSFGKPMVKVRYRLEEDLGEPIILVTGIADGRNAADLARSAGFEVREHLSFRDHADYDERRVRRILKDAGERGCRVAVTGKDWVKWRELGVSRSEVTVLEPQLFFEQGKELWNQILWEN